MNVTSDTVAEATFDIPVSASDGSWDVHVDEMILLQGFTVNLLAGIKDPAGTLFRIYPNPVDRLLFIENAEGADVTLFNSQGKNILTQKITSEKQAIDISRLSPGIYIVRISTGESVSNYRIIKE